MVSMNTDIIKRCPFCGGEAKLMDNGHWVWCQHCLVESAYYDTREEAIKAWNTRKPMDRIVERLEEPTNYTIVKGKHFTTVERAIEIVKEEGVLNERI